MCVWLCTWDISCNLYDFKYPNHLLNDNIYLILMLLATSWMGVIGFIDDYIKVFKKNKEGLSGKFKILGQVGLGLIVGSIMLLSDDVVVRMSAEEAV